MKKFLNALVTSKTIQGIFLTVLGLILKNNGVHIPDEALYLTGGYTAYGYRDAVKPLPE